MFSDQTPTPTRFLQNCEEVGLFKEIEEEFLQAQEEENNKQVHKQRISFFLLFENKSPISMRDTVQTCASLLVESVTVCALSGGCLFARGDKGSQTQLVDCRYPTCCRKDKPGDHILPSKLNSQPSNAKAHTLTLALSSEKIQASLLLLLHPLQTLSHNGPSCMNQQHLKPQLQLQHPPQPPLNHPQGHGPMMAPSCSLAAQQALSCSSGASQSGSVITQAPSTLTHSGWV